jgi:hypothetical protein
MFAKLPWPLSQGAPAQRAAVPAAPPAQVPFMGVPLYYPNWFPEQDLYGSFMTTIFYGSLFIFITFFILVFIHFTMTPVFSLSPNDPGFIPVPTVSDRQIALTKYPASQDMSGNFIGVPSDTYTLSTDVYLTGAFLTGSLPRVILYRSLETKGESPDYTHTTDDLAADFPDTNIIVWVDPMLNDLYVSVKTGTGVLEQSKAITNIPIKKVFRLSIVFSCRFIEIYINGGLEKSMPLKNTVVAVADKAAFFSPINSNILIANLAFWPRVITSAEIRADGKPISNENFFFKET